jgi:surface antigen
MRGSEEAVMRAKLALAFSLGAAACTAPGNGAGGAAATPQSAEWVPASQLHLVQSPQNCRQYTTPVIVGGKKETASGVACELPDGSWRISDNTPGLPAQIYWMPPPGTVPPLPGPPQGQADCREYTVPIEVGGVQKQGIGESCRQPDGSWRITDNTPGLPEQVYLVPPQPYPPPDYAYDPWFYGPPFALAGSFVFVNRFHNFNNVHHGHHGHSHWMGQPWMGGGHHH